MCVRVRVRVCVPKRLSTQELKALKAGSLSRRGQSLGSLLARRSALRTQFCPAEPVPEPLPAHTALFLESENGAPSGREAPALLPQQSEAV